MAQAGHHPPHLSISPFRQNDIQSSSITVAVEDFHLAGDSLLDVDAATCSSVGEHHPSTQSLQFLVGEFSTNGDLVFLLDSIARMRKSSSKCAVVRQDEKPGGIDVKSAHGEEPNPLWVGYQVDGASAILLGCIRTDHASRLEQQNVYERGIGSHALTGDDNVIPGGIDPCRECLDDVAIDKDLACKNQFFTCPA